jgi:hypothetical protein
MACSFCKDLPVRTIRQLNADVSAGELSLEQLSQNYGAEVDDIETHINTCIIASRSGYNILAQLLDDINTVAAERKEAHENDDTNVDAMDQYIALIREARSTVLAMDKLKPSEELVRAIIQQILTPFVNQCALITVDECGRLRDDLQSYIEPELYSRLDQSIKTILRRIAMRLRRDTSDLVPRLRKLLNVQQQAAAQDDLAEEIAIPDDTDAVGPQIN